MGMNPHEETWTASTDPQTLGCVSIKERPVQYGYLAIGCPDEATARLVQCAPEMARMLLALEPIIRQLQDTAALPPPKDGFVHPAEAIDDLMKRAGVR